MAKIKPLKAVCYNQDKIADLSFVVCPPYDIISTPKQDYYHDLSPYNFIHILLGKDILGEDKYQRAANLFKDWLKNKILIQDEKPAIYFYSQEYSIKGEKKTRHGFIALLQLEDRNGSVFGHERTRLEPKEDRLRLLKATQANLSPIFVLFADKKRIIPRIYQKYIEEMEPFIDILNDEKISHKLWRLDSPEILVQIETAMRDEKLFIADGHHRYEVACAYRQQMKKKLGAIQGDEDFNFILAYFTDANSLGLTVFPIHRFLKLSKKLELASFKDGLKDYFDVEEIKDKTRFFFLLQKGGQTEHVLGIYKDNQCYLLRLKNIKILNKLFGDKPTSSLDVFILNEIILKNILKLDLEDKEAITFSAEAEELMDKVNQDNSSVAFFLNPVKVNQIMSIALSGDKMPAKSTYFYPKVLSGLVINKHGPIR